MYRDIQERINGYIEFMMSVEVPLTGNQIKNKSITLVEEVVKRVEEIVISFEQVEELIDQLQNALNSHSNFVKKCTVKINSFASCIESTYQYLQESMQRELNPSQTMIYLPKSIVPKRTVLPIETMMKRSKDFSEYKLSYVPGNNNHRLSTSAEKFSQSRSGSQSRLQQPVSQDRKKTQVPLQSSSSKLLSAIQKRPHLPPRESNERIRLPDRPTTLTPNLVESLVPDSHNVTSSDQFVSLRDELRQKTEALKQTEDAKRAQDEELQQKDELIQSLLGEFKKLKSKQVPNNSGTRSPARQVDKQPVLATPTQTRPAVDTDFEARLAQAVLQEQSLRNELSEMTKQAAQLAAELKAAQEKLNLAARDKQDLGVQLASLQSRARDEASQDLSAIQSVQQECATLRKEREELTSAKTSLENQLLQVRSEYAVLSKDKQNLIQQLASSEQTLADGLQSTSKQLQELKDAKSSLEKELTQMTNQLADALVRLAASSTEVQASQSQVAQLAGLLDELRTAREADMKTFKLDLDRKCQELVGVHKVQLTQLESENTQLKSSLALANGQVEELTADKKTLLAESKNHEMNMQKLKNQLSEANLSLSQLESRKAMLEAELAQQKGLSHKQQTDNEMLRRNVAQLEASTAQLMKGLEEVTSKANQGAAERLIQAERQADMATSKANALELQLTELNRSLEELQGTYSRESQENADKRAQLEETLNQKSVRLAQVESELQQLTINQTTQQRELSAAQLEVSRLTKDLQGARSGVSLEREELLTKISALEHQNHLLNSKTESDVKQLRLEVEKEKAGRPV